MTAMTDRMGRTNTASQLSALTLSSQLPAPPPRTNQRTPNSNSKQRAGSDHPDTGSGATGGEVMLPAHLSVPYFFCIERIR